MKLIIDIPEKDYKNVSRIVDMGLGTNVDEAIKNGTPLDDVKAEIETDLSWDMFDEYGNETRLHKDLMEILDSIGKAESEDNEN